MRYLFSDGLSDFACCGTMMRLKITTAHFSLAGMQPET